MTRRSGTSRGAGERAQSTILLAAVAAVLVAIIGALVGLGVEEVQRGRLQAAADITALAAASSDADGTAIAAANGVEITSSERRDDGTVTVVVTRDGRSAIAAAQR